MRHEIVDGSEDSEVCYLQFELHWFQAELCVVQALRHAWANAQIADRFVLCLQLTAEESTIADMRQALAAHSRGVSTDLFPEIPAQQLIVIPYSLGFVKRENCNHCRVQYHRHPNFEGYMHPLEH